MNMPVLPPYAAEEFETLARQGWTRILEGWASPGQRTTAFRCDMLPHNDRDDPRFRIIVPVSGGLDSATCYRMAVEAGLPVEPVMVDTGVYYVTHDMEAAQAVTGGRLRVLPRRRTWQNGDGAACDVQVGRNSIIVWELLDLATVNGLWGEIWFGNLGGQVLETPIVGGDKSYRWLSAMQHLITATGRDFRLTSPLGGMSKADAVSWWAARGLLNEALTTRSCFGNNPDHCGRCWACLQRFIAFAARGYRKQVEATYPHGIDFADAAAEFWRRAATWRLVTTRPARLAETADVLHGLGLTPAWWAEVVG